MPEAGEISQVDSIITTLAELFDREYTGRPSAACTACNCCCRLPLKEAYHPVMMISSAVAVVIAMTVQDFSFQTCATSMVSGFKMEMFTDPSLNLAGIVQEVPTFSREAVWLP